MTDRRQTWVVTLLFVAMTIVMTWPQVALLATHARDHHDVYFNMWRLGWIARALTTAPSRLFDGNIFYPEPHSLLYSDAMVVEGVLGTPLLMVGLPPVLVHNLLLLGAIISSATGIFVLARHLTGSAGAGVIAGVIFAFVPYRFEHYMHMELQWTMWMPWAFWALHRTIETGVKRYGVLAGVFLSLQMLSSIYYGVFLILLFGLTAVLMLLAASRERLTKAIPVLALGAVIAIVICGLYAQPYLEAKKEVGGRSETEVATFSARPSSYLVATPENVWYGRAFASRGRMERRLFPGTLAVILALIGLFARQTPHVIIAYLLALVAAYEMSLGLSGYSYRLLFDHVAFVQGFRAIARLGIFVVLFLAVLAAYGYTALIAGRRRLVQSALLVGIVTILLLEYRVSTLYLVPYPNTAPPLYAWLAQQPRGVVAELPMPDLDPRVSYLSTFHWQPIVNGYSGFVPASYVDRVEQLKNFPETTAITRLRQDNVRYLVVHLGRYRADEAVLVLQSLKNQHRLRELGRFGDGEGEAAVFFLQ